MTTALARRFKVDVSADATNWIPYKGINDLNPSVTPTTVDTSDFDTDGWTSSEIPMNAWSLVIKAFRKTVAGVFDAGQELVRQCVAQSGDSARIYVRWYDRNGADEAYQGWGIVTWAPSKTGVADVDEVTVTINGDGARTDIANPVASDTAPVLLSAESTPTAQVAGGMVEIHGSGFVGVVAGTGVKFGATAATSFRVISSELIVAVMPAGSAGAANITVTNATGASNSLPYTRGA